MNLNCAFLKAFLSTNLVRRCRIIIEIWTIDVWSSYWHNTMESNLQEICLNCQYTSVISSETSSSCWIHVSFNAVSAARVFFLLAGVFWTSLPSLQRRHRSQRSSSLLVFMKGYNGKGCNMRNILRFFEGTINHVCRINYSAVISNGCWFRR